jgi:hypothetical protein
VIGHLYKKYIVRITEGQGNRGLVPVKGMFKLSQYVPLTA